MYFCQKQIKVEIDAINESREVVENLFTDVYLIPEIEEIDTFGQVTIAWNHDIRKEANDTVFEERLKRWIWTVDIESNITQHVHKPALEVELFNSYYREEPQDLVNITDWSFNGWDGDRKMKLQLYFDRTDVISMEDLPDALNITFWDQRLFLAEAPKVTAAASQVSEPPERNLQEDSSNSDSEIVEGMLYVAKQYEMTKIIPPQVPQDDLAKVIIILANLFTGSFLTLGTFGFFLSYFFT